MHTHTYTRTSTHKHTGRPDLALEDIRKALASKSIETPGRTNTHSVNAVPYHTRTRRIFFEPAFISFPLSSTGPGGRGGRDKLTQAHIHSSCRAGYGRIRRHPSASTSNYQHTTNAPRSPHEPLERCRLLLLKWYLFFYFYFYFPAAGAERT